jgi:serine/threonine protein kinase
MERIEGRSLHEVVEQDGRCEPDVVVSWVRQLADVLDFVHAAGIIHRDVKPGKFRQALKPHCCARSWNSMTRTSAANRVECTPKRSRPKIRSTASEGFGGTAKPCAFADT